MAYLASSLQIPACPPLPRLTLLDLSYVAVVILVGELALLVVILRRAFQGMSTRAVRVGLITAAALIGLLTLSTLAFIVFLAFQDNHFLLTSCEIMFGDPVAEHDMAVFHALEAVVAADPLVGALLVAAALLFAWLAQRRSAY